MANDLMRQAAVSPVNSVSEMADLAADIVTKVLSQAVALRGRASLALSGGNTPRALFRLLAEEPWASQLPWSHVHVFWGDERCVAPDHPESNYGMAHRLLLKPLGLHDSQVHRMRGELTPQEAAEDYQHEIEKHFALATGQFPCFDLILLGVGSDGHTASLFPGHEALNEEHRACVAAYVQKLQTWRLTLTLPVLNAGRRVVFLANGQDKACILSSILGCRPDATLPVSRIKPVAGEVLWIVAP